MLKVIVLSSLLILSSYSFASDEMTKPEQLSECLQNYIQQRIVSPETISWEHYPAYEFSGKYLHASWQTNPLLNFGSMFVFVGPKNDVYCDYPTNSDGSPQIDKGFCKANIESGNITLEHTSFDRQGKEVKKLRNIGFIQNSKLFCFL